MRIFLFHYIFGFFSRCINSRIFTKYCWRVQTRGTQMAVGSWRCVLHVCVCVWWVWGLQTAGGQSPGCLLLMTLARTKGVCCVKDWRLYVLLCNRPTAGHPMETMDTQPVIINNNIKVHIWLYRACAHSESWLKVVFSLLSLWGDIYNNKAEETPFQIPVKYCTALPSETSGLISWWYRCDLKKVIQSLWM